MVEDIIQNTQNRSTRNRAAIGRDRAILRPKTSQKKIELYTVGFVPAFNKKQAYNTYVTDSVDLWPPSVRSRRVLGRSQIRAGYGMDRESVHPQASQLEKVYFFDGIDGVDDSVHVSNDLEDKKYGARPQASQPLVE